MSQQEICSSKPNPVENQDNWVWKRISFHDRKATINHYVRTSIIEDIQTELMIVGADVYREFTNSCFGHFMRFSWQGAKGCNAGMHALLGREVIRHDAFPDEMWFRIGDQFTRFSKYEFALVTGLNFVDSTFDPNGVHSPPETGVYARLIGGSGRVCLDSLRDQFINGAFRQSAADTLKVAKVLFLYFFLFAVDGRQAVVDRWVWTLLEDFDQWENFPWGKYSFQILLHHLRAIPIALPQRANGRTPSYHIYGCVLAFVVWASEAIPSFGIACGEQLTEIELQMPRCLRWRFRRNHGDFTNFFKNEIVCHEKLEPSQEETKQVYWRHVDSDLRLGIQYVHRESRFKRRPESTSRPPVLPTSASRHQGEKRRRLGRSTNVPPPASPPSLAPPALPPSPPRDPPPLPPPPRDAAPLSSLPRDVAPLSSLPRDAALLPPLPRDAGPLPPLPRDAPPLPTSPPPPASPPPIPREDNVYRRLQVIEDSVKEVVDIVDDLRTQFPNLIKDAVKNAIREILEVGGIQPPPPAAQEDVPPRVQKDPLSPAHQEDHLSPAHQEDHFSPAQQEDHHHRHRHDHHHHRHHHDHDHHHDLHLHLHHHHHRHRH